MQKGEKRMKAKNINKNNKDSNNTFGMLSDKEIELIKKSIGNVTFEEYVNKNLLEAIDAIVSDKNNNYILPKNIIEKIINFMAEYKFKDVNYLISQKTIESNIVIFYNYLESFYNNIIDCISEKYVIEHKNDIPKEKIVILIKEVKSLDIVEKERNKLKNNDLMITNALLSEWTNFIKHKEYVIAEPLILEINNNKKDKIEIFDNLKKELLIHNNK